MTTPAPGDGSAARGGDARADGLAEGIARLRRALRRGARVASPGNSLAVAQLELLSALAEHPGARPGQLARLLHMRPNTVTMPAELWPSPQSIITVKSLAWAAESADVKLATTRPGPGPASATHAGWSPGIVLVSVPL